MSHRYERTFFDYFNYFNRFQDAKPIILGGLPGASGGSGGHPGGFAGYLPQGRVAYDTTEASLSGFVSPTPYNSSGILIDASLIDNLNHIRYRLGIVEGIGFSAGTLRLEKSQVLVASGVTILNFEGVAGVTSTGPGEVTVTASGSLTDEKIKISSNDTTTNYLQSKLAAGTNIAITVLNEGGNEQLSLSATGSGLSDELTKVSSNDTTANYLQSKLSAGTNVSITVLNEGANEQLQITASGGSATDEKVKISSNDTTAAYLDTKIAAGTGVLLTVLNEGGNEQLRITASGGTGSPINGKNENIVVASGITFIDFVGPTVQATASGTGLLVTISGYSSPFVGAKAYRTTNQLLSTSTGWQNVNWEATEYESDGTMWSTGANVYVREAGYYKVDTQVTLSGLGTGYYIQLGLFKNGAIVSNIWDGHYVTTSGNRTLYIPYQGLLTTNDYFVLQFLKDSAGQPYILSGVENSFLSLHKIHGQVAAVTADPKLSSVYMGGANYVTVPNITETAIPYTNETYDTASIWSAGDSTKFYAPETGYYHIDAGAAWETIYYHGAVPFQIKIGIRKGGTTMLAQKWEWHDVNNGGARAEGLTTPISCDIYLIGGEYIQVMVWHSKGSSASNVIRPDDYDTYCMMHKIQ